MTKELLNKLKEIETLFEHRHVHDEYSNLRLKDSTNKFEDIVDYVVNTLHQNSVSITNHEALCGSARYIKHIKSLKEDKKIPEDFKLVIGNEIYLTSKELMEEQRKEGSIKFYHFLLQAKDVIGHEQLRKLSSIAWRDNYFNYKNMDRVPTFYEDIERVTKNDKGHLIASSACVGSYLGQNVIKLLSEDLTEDEQEKIKDNIFDFLTWCQNTFGKENFFIELQPSEQEEFEEINKYILRIAKACNIPHIFTCDCHYLTKEDRQIHKAFLTSQDEEGSGAREVDAFYGTTYFMDVYELAEYLSYLDDDDIIEGILNTHKISQMVEEYDLYHPQIVPKVPVPDESTWWYNEEIYNYAKQFEYINKAINSKEIYDRYLVNLALEGLKRKVLFNTLTNEEFEKRKNEHLSRIDIEVMEILGGSEVKGEPVSAYLITEKKNVDIIWEEANSILGTSRGSAGGYLLNYLLGITQINPLVHGDGLVMPHWRFATKERLSFDVMDIDIDIPSHKRDLVFDCVNNYYHSLGGEMIRIGTFKTETSKSAVQSSARGLGINNDVAIYLSSLIPVERGKVRDIKTCYYGDKEKGIEPITEFKNGIDEYPMFLETILKTEGLISGRSTHSCAVVIYGEDISKYGACMRAPSGELITQFDLHDAEYMGGLKYDFLNTKTCSMIQICLELLVKYGEIEWQGSLRKTYDKYLHPDVIDRTTPEMWDMIDNLIGAFQYDTAINDQWLQMVTFVEKAL